MGNTFEVVAWVRLNNIGDLEQYEDQTVYRGEVLGDAIEAMLAAKETSGCVKFIWRGSCDE